MSKKKLIIIICCSAAALLLLGGALYAYKIFTGIAGETLDENRLSINTKLDETVVNVALFGLDGRYDPETEIEGERSDAILIASANFETGEIKVVSVMRDLIARIPDTEVSMSYYEKINAAYSFGGPQAAIQTLNENFDLNIADYVAVDFNCVVDTVNALGGIDINIQNEDVLEWTNAYIQDVNRLTNHDSPYLRQIGTNHVDGVQALGYCRNRYSDSDFGRTERQREVLSQMAKKAMNMDVMTAVNLIGKIYPYVRTSLTLSEMTKYFSAYMQCENRTMSTARLPFDMLNTMDSINEISYIIPTTMEDNVKVLHGYLYNEDQYYPSDTVTEISDHICALSGAGSNADWSVQTWQDIMNNQTSVRDNNADTLSPDSFPPAENSASRSAAQ